MYTKNFKYMLWCNSLVIALFLMMNVVIYSEVQVKEDKESLYMAFEEATIMEVSQDEKRFTILPKGSTPTQEHIITIILAKEGTIEYPSFNRVYPFEVLQEGMKVSIRYLTEKVQTKPYYEATYIEILNNEVGSNDFLPSLEQVYIQEINQKNQWIIVSACEDGTGKKTLVYIDHHTNIRDTLGNTHYHLEVLKPGQKVTIITNGVMTKSEMGQTVGLEIILLEQ